MLQFIGVLVAAFAVGGICRRFDVAAPLPLIAAGVALGLAPGSGSLALDPDVVLLTALPPLVFASALTTSYIGIRQNLSAILSLSVGLVAFTAATVGWVTSAVLAPIPWAVALALGAILAPSDAVATSAVAGRAGMNRRTRTVLEGEALVNDGTALTLFNIAVAAAVAGTVSGSELAIVAGASVVGGLALGVAGGLLARWVIDVLDDSLLENALVLVVPFGLFAAAELVEASGFLAVAVAGLLLSRAAGRAGATTRIQLNAIWAVVTFVLETLAFFIVGFELPHLIESMHERGELSGTAWPALAVLLTVIAARLVWVLPAMWLPQSFLRLGERRDDSRRAVAVVSWAGMRGPISVFAAVGLPRLLDDGSAFPERDRLQLITSIVVVATLLLQGSTLAALMRRVGATVSSSSDDAIEAEARRAASRSAMEHLEIQLRDRPDLPESITARLRQLAQSGQTDAEHPRLHAREREEFRRVRMAMIDAERRVIFTYRDDGRLPEEIARRMITALDYDEAALDR